MVNITCITWQLRIAPITRQRDQLFRLSFKEMHNLSWQKVIKGGDSFCQVPKGSAGKTPDIDLLVESAQVAFYSFCDGWIDKKHC